MSLAGLTSVHAYEVLKYTDKTGAAMGKGKEWLKVSSGRCRFSTLQGGKASNEAKAADFTVTHAVFFSTDPAIPNGSRLRWTGYYNTAGVFVAFTDAIVMKLTGPVVNADGLNRLWKVMATTHDLENLDAAVLT